MATETFYKSNAPLVPAIPTGTQAKDHYVRQNGRAVLVRAKALLLTTRGKITTHWSREEADQNIVRGELQGGVIGFTHAQLPDFVAMVRNYSAEKGVSNRAALKAILSGDKIVSRWSDRAPSATEGPRVDPLAALFGEDADKISTPEDVLGLDSEDAPMDAADTIAVQDAAIAELDRENV